MSGYIAYVCGVPQTDERGRYITDDEEPIIGASYRKGEPSQYLANLESYASYQSEFSSAVTVQTMEERTDDRWAELDTSTYTETLGRHGVVVEVATDSDYAFADTVWVEGEQMSVLPLIDLGITERYHKKLMHMWTNRNGRQMCGYVELGMFLTGEFAARCWKCGAQMRHMPLGYDEQPSYERAEMERFTHAVLIHGDRHRKHFSNEEKGWIDESTAKTVVPRIGDWQWTSHPRYWN